jgi:hypothetical protein
VWALRNVGATLALGGPGERARARQMLERAALLKARWVGAERHPGARGFCLCLLCSCALESRPSMDPPWIWMNDCRMQCCPPQDCLPSQHA